jgi:enterochelin esterase-like enzyme
VTDLDFRLSDADEAALLAAREATGDPLQGPDSAIQPGVPQGSVTQFHHVSPSVYPGVARDYWVYVPAQYDATKPAALMVFQDGASYLRDEVNVPVVFDNLIARGEMPVTVAVLVMPGDKGPGQPINGGDNNRSFEYDSLGDQYVRYLLDELLPIVGGDYAISADPALRAICGMSSGGICAFTAAWERPDSFGKVLSHCGSFANIRGGHNYPSMVRRAEKKPIRAFLTTGKGDLNNIFGHWPIANEDMAAALAFKGYDFRFEVGQGGHTLKHGGAILPQSLRWLWRGH